MKESKSSGKNKIHILLVHQAFAALDEPGGTRHYEMARAFVQNGHRVTIITSPVSYLTGKSAGGKMKWKTLETPGKPWDPKIGNDRDGRALHGKSGRRQLQF